MRKSILTGALVVSLATISPLPTHAQSQPEPKLLACALTCICLGVLIVCVGACYYHALTSDYSGPTNSPPIVPIEPPTNNIVTNTLPPMIIDATAASQSLDVSASNWIDSAGSPVTNLSRTTIQTATCAAGPFTTTYVVTLWQSPYGNTMIVQDGSGNELASNYSARTDNGSVTNYAPLELDLSQPARFWRARE